MTLSDLDCMIEFAIEDLATGEADKITSLVRRMAERWPTQPALSLCFALTNAASRLEALIAGPATDRAAVRAYKLAALVAADILLLDHLGGRRPTANDLLHFWRRLDPPYLQC